ncbi:multicopper oxidase family protein [Actinomycetospora soli]|uniref:multicopper oxidase family protein n=1 Tax=Actinomycetospora soli TaxID=2893887 RepID=UPI001E4879C3|nr:multicopper oxidase domain-containing protein [Actinomycetospora soli]MCD2191146.1 multicopper oxidase domain-containing protein [Actinomycetospora soli]
MTSFDKLSKPTELFDRAAEMPRPRRRRLRPSSTPARIEQRATDVVLHPDLPPTPVWAYDGTLPGPVIEVRSDDEVDVVHDHDINGRLPYAHVVTVSPALGNGTPMNHTGSGDASPDLDDVEEAKRAAALHAYTVAHLHGAPSEPGSDGWAENVIGCGEERRDTYQFTRETWPMLHADDETTTSFRSGAAPMYWYHDHGMGVTRFNVFAGLAGAWLVRDPLEHHLGLPTDPGREIPLVISDRNLETVDGTENGELTGRLLHKVTTDVREFFGPVTLVNGLAWPRCSVPRRVIRLRVLNACNARTLRLHLHTTTTDGEAGVPLPTAAVQQIGTDGGLLGAAIDLPPGGLVLAPAERADLLVDLGLLDPEDTHVVVWNSAPAPWNGQKPRDPIQLHEPSPDGLLPVPQVMRFELQNEPARPHLDDCLIQGMPLDPEFRSLPTDHERLPSDHGHTLLAMVEESPVVYDDHGEPRKRDDQSIVSRTMLVLHELIPVEVADRDGINMHAQTMLVVDPNDATAVMPVPAGLQLTLPGDPTVYVTCGKRFNDATRVMATQHGWHLWKILNLSPDTHPFHVHLTQFQAISRRRLVPAHGTLDPGSERQFDLLASTDPDDAKVTLDANEKGWKDTFRVDPGRRDEATDAVHSAEMVTIAGNFGAHSGRYMYHCHIIEHEDMEMMRPFSVLPADLMAFMDHHHH